MHLRSYRHPLQYQSHQQSIFQILLQKTRLNYRRVDIILSSSLAEEDPSSIKVAIHYYVRCKYC